ncbi:Deuterolysin metalloprotease family-domain-containing protein [Aspergillus pseudonomiae]|uniref:Neutral protease 2 n=1 Tax=Aspergillus pseudonomiae TaxID=1506151 RepID=A0A5N7DHZ6_9EURO|nr:Deuterolysin metalloprotease family-domain-containing protein [Aspergillus pseudonomiae]KAB8264147.1 Deuterolysin metalloprotease family-domain-containing protein [Aspergillus pseudonomiae]KAE8405633.1 Deuterolysin metalloprotease family-domain-containing protein [Aspergillus pseudonomiae]
MSFIQLVHFFGLLTLAAGKPVLIPRQASGAPQDGARNLIDVQLQALGNSTVKAFITNIADENLRVVKRGGLLDNELPTKKVAVSGSGGNPTFTGAEVDYINSHLNDDAFMELAPKQTIESIFDIADSHDLVAGQKYSAIADGNLEYTKLDNPKKFFVVPYTSNTIDFDAPEDSANRLATRATLEGCSGEQNKLMQENLAQAAKMAEAAAADARDGSSGLFQKFFKSQDEADKKEVAERLEAIAKEATSKGTLNYYCQPSAQDSCGGNIAAITYPTLNRVVNCQAYYETQQVVNQCGYLDQAAISLHEFSHATSVYAPGTEDVVYGLDGVLQLSTAQAKNNADSFAYYANSVFNNCSADGNQNGNPGTQPGSSTGMNNGGGFTIPWEQGTGQGNEQGGNQGAGQQTGGSTGMENGGGFTIPWGQGIGQGNEQEVNQGAGQQTNQGGMAPWGQQGGTAQGTTQPGSEWPAGFDNLPWSFNNPEQGAQSNGGQFSNEWQPVSNEYEEVSTSPSGYFPVGAFEAPERSQGFELGEGSGWFKRDQ